ncbi:MAG: hypothetical protein QOC85_3515, partial [Streptomyces sp.]|nr:hypothetical protein [Streptomyces sp.]
MTAVTAATGIAARRRKASQLTGTGVL